MVAVCPRISAVLFDVGGTLVYEPDVDGWVEQARLLNFIVDPVAFAQAYVGVLTEVDEGTAPRDAEESVVEFWRRVIARTVGKDVSSTAATKFVVACGEKSAPVRLHPDARGCLDQLRDDRRALGVISNSTSEEVVRMVLHRADILDYFDCIVSSGTEGVAKPDPEIFLRAVRWLGVLPAEALYVGDKALTDAVAAQAAGLHGVWVNREALEHGPNPPEISSLLEIPVYVRHIEQGLPTV